MASSSYIRKLVEILFLIPNILRLHSSKSDTIRDDHKGSHKNFGIDVAVFFKSIPGSGLVSGKSSSNFVQLFQKTRQNFRSISQKVKKKKKLLLAKKTFQSKLTQKNRLELNYFYRSRTRFTYEGEAGLPTFQLYSKYSEFPCDFAYR